MTRQVHPLYFLIEPDPAVFLDLLFSRLVEPVDLVLIDPGTPPATLERLKRDLMPDGILGEGAGVPDPSSARWTPPSGDFEGRILISTGGTGGKPRFAIHTWGSLRAAAVGFGQRFPGPADSLCLLPLWHVGGLMQAVRAHVCGGGLKLACWPDVEKGPERPEPAGLLLSLVPTQLERLLNDRSATRWLSGFRAVFLGGGPAWPELLERARTAGVRLAPAYGMTETAAQVTVLMPEAFLSGHGGVGRALPHASISILNERGIVLPAGQPGRIRIESESLFAGYHGETGDGPGEAGYLSGDLGVLDGDGCLTVLGRLDDVIISGGEKVVPTEVESVIRQTGLAGDVVVFGLPDREWGTVVCAVVAGGSFQEAPSARRVLAHHLPAHAIPQKWASVERLPRNAMGKLDRSQLPGLIDGST